MPRPNPMTAIAYRRETILPLSREQAWPIVAGTDRVNREAGFAPMELRITGEHGAARMLGQTKLGPLSMEFEELPFEWREPERLAVERRFPRGPIERLRVSFGLEAIEPERTRILTTLESRLRNGLFRPFAQLAARSMLRRLDRAMLLLGQHQEPRAPRPQVGREALARATQALTAKLEPDRADLVSRLASWVSEGADHELLRIRPFELADRWHVDRRVMLEVFLAATVEGLLELQWELVCPSCRGPAMKTPHLDEVGDHSHCGLCDLSFGVELDRSVEAIFHPAAAIRRVEPVRFCSGGPLAMPHVISQVVLEAGRSAALGAPSAPGRYRVFVRGGLMASLEVAAGGPASVRIEVREQLTPKSAVLAPGGEVEMLLCEGEPRHAKLERLEWSSFAATAHTVSTLPLFRERFSSEVLRPNVALKVRRAALIFTDLSRSTALYAELGDAAAFRIVQDHFELLQRIIASHGGAVVKTIGDAVMAAFEDDAHALKAAVEMQLAFPEFCSAHSEAHGLALKVGVHSGPCYAVTANGALDYFGQTVNVAARLQAQADAGEIVLDAELAELAERSGWLGRMKIGQVYEASLKGVTGPIRAARVR